VISDTSNEPESPSPAIEGPAKATSYELQWCAPGQSSGGGDMGKPTLRLEALQKGGKAPVVGVGWLIAGEWSLIKKSSGGL